MIRRIRVSPVNSLLFLMDAKGGRAPDPIWGQMIHSSPSCISFACFPEVDGPTEIAIGPAGEVQPEPLLVFKGELETPSRMIVLETAEHERILDVPVTRERTIVHLWYSHPKWPEKIVVGLD
ncbi:hypothetical protein [Undibacter mobilis]|uniref:hypothetical protein n=1 Tax=Undibacter mobilis TaxID=2292256 RepID=UPI0011C0751B|nr:hypothetical protein [Undibacter mobilis]